MPSITHFDLYTFENQKIYGGYDGKLTFQLNKDSTKEYAFLVYLQNRNKRPVLYGKGIFEKSLVTHPNANSHGTHCLPLSNVIENLQLYRELHHLLVTAPRTRVRMADAGWTFVDLDLF